MSLFFVGLLFFRLKPEGFSNSGAMYRAVPTDGDVVLPLSTVSGSDMIPMIPYSVMRGWKSPSMRMFVCGNRQR